VGLQDQISIAEADFRSVPLRDGCAQVVWSQESLLHAPDRGQVLQEAARLLQADGALLFTDILQTGPMAQDEAQGIYERVKIDSLESFESYTDLLRQTGFTLEQQVDLSRYMADSYADHIDKIEAHRAELVAQIGPDYVDYTVEAMGRWVAAAQAGKIGWGMFVARRAEA
jgi:sarcosine/dimethylglycine N-methyltransferase